MENVDAYYGKKLLSGTYPKDSEGGKFLSKKWDGHFKKDLGRSGFNNYEEAYNSDVQKKLRDEKVISNNGNEK